MKTCQGNNYIAVTTNFLTHVFKLFYFSKIQELKQARLNLIQPKKAHPNQLLDLKVKYDSNFLFYRILYSNKGLFFFFKKKQKQFNTNLRENFINHYAKSKFLQCILQDPPVLITDNILHEIGKTT